MVRHSVFDDGLSPLTELNITSIVSLTLLLLLFEVIGYPRIGDLTLAPHRRQCGRLTMVEGRGRTGMNGHHSSCANPHSLP